MRKVRSPFVDAGELSRREFLRTSALFGASAGSMALLSACGVSPTQVGAQSGELETTMVKLANYPGVCLAPLFMAEDLLRAEGFTDVQYVGSEFDFAMQFAGPSLLNTNPAIKIVGAVDTGCWELFGSDKVKDISDLKGKTIGVGPLGQVEQVYMSLVLAYVGLDPDKDVTWLNRDLGNIPSREEQQKLFTDGKIDAMWAWPPQNQELRAKKIGHTIVDSMIDKPWSQYFCSMITAFGGFADKYPVATKRVVRAVLKAADICDREKERTARAMMDFGVTDNYDYALEAVQMIPFNHWREYDPVDTLRFYALRLHDVGMLKGNPEEVISQVADWHYFNEVKAELKEA